MTAEQALEFLFQHAINSKLSVAATLPEIQKAAQVVMDKLKEKKEE